ncbi:hypothetical protein BJ508DRAFT_301892 [Ascobolus immersus RN42]|uniref:Uncharacterized protein n=1 Tax=Ascobolus immersus RN42 TaxID=1160509 RepID=A0A3N4IKY0_ASCIM|nr:hypothetical protein BJ508DRAFT_301892 [Ascobolus immersus RN42]
MSRVSAPLTTLDDNSSMSALPRVYPSFVHCFSGNSWLVFRDATDAKVRQDSSTWVHIQSLLFTRTGSSSSFLATTTSSFIPTKSASEQCQKLTTCKVVMTIESSQTGTSNPFSQVATPKAPRYAADTWQLYVVFETKRSKTPSACGNPVQVSNLALQTTSMPHPTAAAVSSVFLTDLRPEERLWWSQYAEEMQGRKELTGKRLVVMDLQRGVTSDLKFMVRIATIPVPK